MNSVFKYLVLLTTVLGSILNLIPITKAHGCSGKSSGQLTKCRFDLLFGLMNIEKCHKGYDKEKEALFLSAGDKCAEKRVIGLNCYAACLFRATGILEEKKPKESKPVNDLKGRSIQINKKDNATTVVQRGKKIKGRGFFDGTDFDYYYDDDNKVLDIDENNNNVLLRSKRTLLFDAPVSTNSAPTQPQRTQLVAQNVATGESKIPLKNVQNNPGTIQSRTQFGQQKPPNSVQYDPRYQQQIQQQSIPQGYNSGYQDQFNSPQYNNLREQTNYAPYSPSYNQQQSISQTYYSSSGYQDQSNSYNNYNSPREQTNYNSYTNNPRLQEQSNSVPKNYMMAPVSKNSNSQQQLVSNSGPKNYASSIQGRSLNVTSTAPRNYMQAPGFKNSNSNPQQFIKTNNTSSIQGRSLINVTKSDLPKNASSSLDKGRGFISNQPGVDKYDNSTIIAGQTDMEGRRFGGHHQVNQMKRVKSPINRHKSTKPKRIDLDGDSKSESKESIENKVEDKNARNKPEKIKHHRSKINRERLSYWIKTLFPQKQGASDSAKKIKAGFIKCHRQYSEGLLPTGDHSEADCGQFHKFLDCFVDILMC